MRFATLLAHEKRIHLGGCFFPIIDRCNDVQTTVVEVAGQKHFFVGAEVSLGLANPVWQDIEGARNSTA